jgi:hypothetical protein
MKKFIPLGTALLSLVAICSVFFKYFGTKVIALGKQVGDTTYTATLGDKGALSNMEKVLGEYPFYRTSAILYIIALVLLALVIAIAVLNFLGIGGKNVGYAFIGVSFIAFVVALISTILLFKTKTVGSGDFETGFKYIPGLASWWITGFSFLAMLSTGNVLLGKKGKKRHHK